ncbi:uncharacterized protein LOC127854658 [Dreissena polymorpha]|uniref:uncharacterized protein LOC127854658 n=1 Tax=Dreissena polymorpha TaxID=45954 RepID=UPI0022653846|nr:uncharacterized protein LOC127854658 [Dreissena polymorpha]
MAGLGETCSHVAAILFKMEIAARWKFTEKSSTDVGRMWNQHFKEQVDPAPVTNMQHLFGNRKKTVASVTPSGKDPLPSEEILIALYQACPNASFFNLIPEMFPGQRKPPQAKEDPLPFMPISLYREEGKEMTPTEVLRAVDDLIANTKVTQEQVIALYNKTKTQNISPLWYNHRKGRITASKAHEVLTLRESTCRANLVMRVIGYKTYNLSNKESIKWGLDNESVARDLYTKHLQSQHTNFDCVQSGFMVYETCPFFGASADGVISCSCCGTGILEIKCPFKHRGATIQEAALSDKDFCIDRNMQLKTGHKYYTQVQFQLFVYEVQFCDFVIMTQPASGNSMLIVRIFRDNVLIDKLQKCCQDFLKNHLVPEIFTQCLKNKETTAIKHKESDVLWCICNEPEYGKMIMCSNEECLKGWYHYGCVNIKRKSRGKWVCARCK